MDRSEYESLVQREDRKLEARRAEAQADHAAAIKALDRVWTMSQEYAQEIDIVGESNQPVKLTAPQPARRTVTAKNGVQIEPGIVVPTLSLSLKRGNAEAVRSVLKELPDQFSVRNILDALHRKGSKIDGPAVSSVMHKLNVRGLVHQLSPGRGKIAAVYTLPEKLKKMGVDELLDSMKTT